MNDKISRLEALKKKQAQLQARIQKLEAMDKVKKRKEDTRRKILIGSYFIDKAMQDGTMDELYQGMQQYIKRDNDKVLFKSVFEEECTDA